MYLKTKTYLKTLFSHDLLITSKMYLKTKPGITMNDNTTYFPIAQNLLRTRLQNSFVDFSVSINRDPLFLR